MMKWLKNLITKRPSLQELYEAKNYSEIVSIGFRDTVEPDELQMIANAHLQTENKELGYKIFRKALAHSNPYTKNRIRQNIAISLYNDSKYKDAIGYLQEIDQDFIKDEHRDKNYNVVKLLGSSWYHLKEYKLAIEAFRKAPVNSKYVNNDLKELIYLLALAYEKDSNSRMALRMLEKVKTIDVNYFGIDELIEEIQLKVNNGK